MLNSKRLMLAITVLSMLAHVAVAQQNDMFWSPHDLNGGATNADASLDVAVGEPHSLFLYVSTANFFSIGPGAFLDVVTSQTGVIEFTDAESFDFPIVVTELPDIHVDNRWLDEMGGGGSAGHTGTVTADLIDEWHAFTVTGGQGILASNNGSGAFLDLGYDAGADAFLFGRIVFVAVGTGSVDLITTAGSGGVIVDGNMSVEPAVAAVTINVTDGILLGDINLDGVVNLADVNPFVVLLASSGFQAEADINQDGVFTSLDIPPFVDLLSDL